MIYLIRHGQASFLKSDYDKLSDLGVTQSEILGSALKNRKATTNLIEAGSMVRHYETATHCLKQLELSGYIENNCWNEYNHAELLAQYNPDFADFEHLSNYIRSQADPLKSLQQLLNASINDWIADKNSYQQRWADFKSNVWTALEALASQLGKRDNAWVFTSGGPIAAVMIKLLNLNDSQFVNLQCRLVNTSITRVIVGRSGLSLSTFNEYGHLEHQPELITYR